MKTYHIKDILTKEVFIIETPKGGYYSKDLHAIIAYGIMHNIPEGYTLLGKPDEVSEEDAMELVEAPEPYWEDNKNQKVIGNAKWSYTKALLSILESKIYWDVNPLGDEPNKFYAARDFYGNPRISRRWSKWHEAESRTFDKKRTLIFVKN